MKRKIFSLVMAFMFVASCLVAFASADGLTVFADTVQITKPTVTFCLKMTDNSTTTATVDMNKQTVTFSYYIKGVETEGDLISASAHCSSASLHLQFDTSVFTYVDASGSFMGNRYFDTSFPSDGVLFSVMGDGDDLLSISGDIVVTLKYEQSKLSKYDFTFPSQLTLYSSLYKTSPVVFEKSFTASLCTHTSTKQITHAADCQDGAYTQTVCAVCGKAMTAKVYSDKTKGAHVYDYEDIIRYRYTDEKPLPSKCTSASSATIYTEIKCRLCSQSKNENNKIEDMFDVTDLDYHTKLDTSKKVLINGVYCYYCSDCGKYVTCKIQEGSVSEHTHTYKDEVVVKATCTEKGIEKHTCTICAESYTTEIAPIGHTFGSAVTTKAATCTETGISTKTCTVCGYKDETVIESLGHAYGAATVTTAPTCVSDGISSSICTRCGEQQTAVIPATGAHTFTEWVNTQTGNCITQAQQEHHCTVCGYSETQTGEFGEHNYVSTIVQKRTCCDDGIIRYTCTHCGDTYDEKIEASGHIFGYGVTDGKSVSYKCSTCDYTVYVVTENDTKYLKITDGTFVAVLKNPAYAAMDISAIDFSWTKIDTTDAKYSDNAKNLAQYNAIKGTTYSIQELYEFHLFVNGEEVALDDTTTVSITLGEALKKSNTAVIFYTEIGGNLSIQEMATATRKKLNVTFPGASLGVSANNIVILAVEGSRVDAEPGTAEDPVNPGKSDTTTGGGSALVPIIVVVVLVVAAGVGITVVALSGKKGSGRKNNRFDF